MNAGEVVRLDSANEALKLHFLNWQCRLRQMIMREREGKPDQAIMPDVVLKGETDSIGQIITVMSKRAEYSKVPELKHLYRKTHDPAQRRTAALTLFSETYYQKAPEFSDILTSTFVADSEGARRIRQAGHVTLEFRAFRQRYDIPCKVWRLSQHNPLWQSTYWHNLLFNPTLASDTVILGFEPDWQAARANPMPG